MNEKRVKKILPLGLLVEGRACLVVGGGTVAGRKAESLVEAGANVTIVAPELGERVMALQSVYGVTILPRSYTPDDLDQDFFLVIAATDDRALNQQIIEICRARRILCACPDRGWQNGDFISPASFRKGDVTVSVSTGGASCRRSRLIKNSLSRHVDMADAVDCVVIGTSHQQLKLGDRERFHLGEARLNQTGRMLMRVWGIHEFMLLDTCNRIELLAVKSRDAGTHNVLRRIMGFDQLAPEHYYVKRGFEAFEHAALLTTGLLSQVPGENHIVAQVKEALAYAMAYGWAGGMIGEWMAAALHISKDIRQQMPVLLNGGEIEDVCIRYLRQTVAQPDARIVVLGTGVVGRGVVQRVAAAGGTCDWIYHRHAPDSASVPAGGRLHPWCDLLANLRQADVVVCATASQAPVLGPAHAVNFAQDHAVLLIDLATPHSIDPALAAALPKAHLADLDVLKGWHRQTAGSLEPALKLSRTAIHEHRAMYEKIIESFQGRNESK